MATRRNSKKREEILNVLKNCHGALSAAQIHSKVSGMDITTVYRNLEIFVNEGIVRKLNLGSDEAQYEFTKEPHHHAICSDCNRVLHFSAPTEKLKKILELPDFETESIEITMHGKCKH